MGVSKNMGKPPKSSILGGFSIINHPFWGTPIFGNIHIHTWTFQRVPNGAQRVSIHNALGSNWHPLEGAGIYIYIHISLVVQDVFHQQST